MIDIVIPNNNEEEFILIAGRIGYDTLIFLYNFSEYSEKQKNNTIKSGKIKIYTGILADKKNIDKVKNRFRNKGVFVAIKSSNIDREVIERPKADLIFSLEENSKKDFMHQRGSGLNHIMCKLAHDNSLIIGFSLSSLLHSEKKYIILGRMMQNIKLCRKYKVKTAIASFSSNPFDMRSPNDIVSLFTSLGMQQKDVKDSVKIVLNK